MSPRFGRHVCATVAAVLLAAGIAGSHGSLLAGARRAEEDDLSAARRLFTANLDAIQRRDRAAYLACYLDSETLARTGPEGFQLGYRAHAAQSDDGSWPDLFEARDLRLVPVVPGTVYGTYRYRVRYGDDEQTGLSERLFLKTKQGWRIAMTSAFPAPAATPPPPRALTGATLLDGTGAAAISDSVILIRAGKIECAGTRSRCAVPEGVETLDLSGLYVTPGLVDAHVHFSQTGWVDGRPDAIDLREDFPYETVQAGLKAHPERWFRSYLCSGVTSVFDVGGYPWTWDLRGRGEADTRAPHVEAAGPLLSTLDFWLTLPGERQFLYLADAKAARAGVQYLKSQKTSAVKVWFIPVAERNFEEMTAAVMAAGEEARAAGLPLIVHATGLKEAKVALAAGARLLVHSVWDAPVDDEFMRLVREKGTIYCPTLTVALGYERIFESAAGGRAPVVDDPGGCVDAETMAHIAETPRLAAGKVDPAQQARRMARSADRQRIMAENLKRLHEAGVPIAMGTDAGNPLTLHGPSVFAEMEAMQAAGMPAADVLVAATRGGALAMGRLTDLGTVEAGKAADLLIVAGDPAATISNLRKIRYVVRGGVVRGAEELRVRAVTGASP